MENIELALANLKYNEELDCIAHVIDFDQQMIFVIYDRNGNLNSVSVASMVDIIE